MVNSILKAAISNSNLNNLNLSNNEKTGTKEARANFFYKSGESSSAAFKSCSNSFKATSDTAQETPDLLLSKKMNISQQNLLPRQKSASTEYLNLINHQDDSAKTNLHLKNNYTFDSTNVSHHENSHDDKNKDSFSPRLSPNPPQIQQFSGVLSKSLCSVVRKPQPLKPIIDFKTNSTLQQNLPQSEQVNRVDNSSLFSCHPQINKKSKNIFRNTTNNKLLLKKKCVSTTNLKYDDSANNSSFITFGEDKLTSNFNKSIAILKSSNKIHTKSVSFLNIDQANEINKYYKMRF